MFKIMYTPSSMILSFSYLKNIFTKYSQFCPAAIFLFQAKPADRPGRPATVLDMHACACPSADRPGRPTDCRLLSGFLGRPDGRPPSETCVSIYRTVDPTGRPEPNGYCHLGGRPTGLVDRQACKSPTALSSFVYF